MEAMERLEVEFELLEDEELEDIKSSIYFFIGSDVIGWPF